MKCPEDVETAYWGSSHLFIWLVLICILSKKTVFISKCFPELYELFKLLNLREQWELLNRCQPVRSVSGLETMELVTGV